MRRPRYLASLWGLTPVRPWPGTDPDRTSLARHSTRIHPYPYSFLSKKDVLPFMSPRLDIGASLCYDGHMSEEFDNKAFWASTKAGGPRSEVVQDANDLKAIKGFRLRSIDISALCEMSLQAVR